MVGMRFKKRSMMRSPVMAMVSPNPMRAWSSAEPVKSFELVEIDRIPVRHDKAVKEHGEPLLAEGVDLIGFAQNLRARRNQDVLPVVGIDIVGDKTVDGA